VRRVRLTSPELGRTNCRITGGVVIPLRYIIAVDEIRD